MLADDQVKAVLAIKKNFVISTGWKIKCDDEEVSKFITEALEHINEGTDLETSIDEILHDILSCYEYGFSLSERIFTLNDESMYVYQSIKTRPPHTFRFDIDDKGYVKQILQETSRGELSFNPQLFLHHVYQPTFGNPYGRSDLAAAHNPWKTKKFIDRFYAIYAEKFATPTIVGRYPKNTDRNEIDKLHEVLKTIQNNTVLVMPDGTVVDFVQNQRDSSDVYKNAIEHYDTRIARALLVPDLMGVSGGKTGGGSFALGKKQFELLMGTIQKDRESLEKKLTSKIVRPLVEMNFGPDIEACFEFLPFKDEDRIDLARIWVDAVKGNMFDPNDEEINHLRAISGFPEGDVVRVAQPAQAMLDSEGNPMKDAQGNHLDVNGQPIKPNPRDAAGQQGGGKPGDKPVPGQKGQEANKNPDKSKKDAQTYREMTSYEKKVDFTSVGGVLDRLDETGTKNLITSGTALCDDLIAQIRDKGLLKKFKPEALQSIQVKNLRSMNAAVKNHFKELFMDAYEEARKEIFPSSTKKFAEALPGDDYLRILESESFKIVGDYNTEMTKRARNLIVDGLKNGATDSSLIKLLRDELDNASDRWLTTLVRTKNTEIYNNARRSYWENDEMAKQIVEAYQFSAILDQRTSEVCSSLDGQVFEVGEDVSRVTPPLHFNCRSLLVPVTKFEEYSPDKIPSVKEIQDKGGNLKNF